MTIRTITEPAAEPLTLDEVKAQCRTSGTDEDALLQLYIAAARKQAESLTGRSLITRTLEQVLDAFPDGALKLGRPPLLSIISVQYVPTGSTSLTTLDAGEYVQDVAYAADGPGFVLPVTTWPATADLANSVRVQFTAGYGSTAASVPGDIRAWLLLTVATMYAQREAIDAAGRATALPGRFYDSLLDDYRTYYE